MEDDFSHFALNKESKQLSALENVMRDKATARYDIIHREMLYFRVSDELRRLDKFPLQIE